MNTATQPTPRLSYALLGIVAVIVALIFAMTTPAIASHGGQHPNATPGMKLTATAWCSKDGKDLKSLIDIVKRQDQPAYQKIMTALDSDCINLRYYGQRPIVVELVEAGESFNTVHDICFTTWKAVDKLGDNLWLFMYCNSET